MAASTVTEAVYKKIEPDATAESYYGNGLYLNEVPSSVVPPYTVFWQLGDENENTLILYNNQGTARFQFDIVVENMDREMDKAIDGVGRQENLKRWVRDNFMGHTNGTLRIDYVVINDAPVRQDIDTGVMVYSFEATFTWRVI